MFTRGHHPMPRRTTDLQRVDNPPLFVARPKQTFHSSSFRGCEIGYSDDGAYHEPGEEETLYVQG